MTYLKTSTKFAFFSCYTQNVGSLYKNMACVSMERTEDRDGFPDATVSFSSHWTWQKGAVRQWFSFYRTGPPLSQASLGVRKVHAKSQIKIF